MLIEFKYLNRHVVSIESTKISKIERCIKEDEVCVVLGAYADDFFYVKGTYEETILKIKLAGVAAVIVLVQNSAGTRVEGPLTVEAGIALFTELEADPDTVLITIAEIKHMIDRRPVPNDGA